METIWWNRSPVLELTSWSYLQSLQVCESASLQVCNADFGFDHLEAREHFQQAANEGLVDNVL